MKKIILLICLIVIILCGCSKETEKENDDPFANVTVNDRNIELCVDINKCDRPSKVSYNTISYDTKNEKILKIVDDVNKKINDGYNMTINSKLDKDMDCNGLKGIYNYQKYVYTEYHYFKDLKYFVLGTTRTEYDLCNKTTVPYQADVYIYNIEKDKVISQDEFKKELGITNNYINDKIDESLSGNKPIIDYNDVVIFYDGDSGLVASYKVSDLNMYMTTNITLD